MDPIIYIDRASGRQEVEKVYGAKALKFLYGDDLLSRLFGWPLLHLIVKTSLFSALYGYWQKLSISKRKIAPFIKNFNVDPSEFLEKAEYYSSFNDFFIRKLKKESRPMAVGQRTAVIPADGRYFFYQNLSETEGFVVKDRKFIIQSLINDASLAKKYINGSMVIARLCPTDYHRFHFPCDCIPNTPQCLNGWLYSVNPIAIKKNIEIFIQNKRMLTKLQTSLFGEVLFLEIGATNVGSIHQTFMPHAFQSKGAEKGYFAFGASALVILFEPQRIVFDSDLLAATAQGLEIKCLMGQSMGHTTA